MSETPLLPSHESNTTFPPDPPPVEEISDETVEKVQKILYDESTTVATVATFLSAVEAQFLAIALGGKNWHSSNIVLIFSLLFTLLGGLKACQRAHWMIFAHRDALRLVTHRYLYITGRINHPPHVADKPRIVDRLKAYLFDNCFSAIGLGLYLFILWLGAYIISRDFEMVTRILTPIASSLAFFIELLGQSGKLTPTIDHMWISRTWFNRMDGLGCR
ncbi:uncharacterized protein EI90DRAFT_3013485 [Cantharellus anzutake]|uniref:uncharacterized protein n=1 Tax=Cantharellus anzutake TaxID=1750568 RepID=UPI00190462F9|nr:uncharacterized protein EI90DRAFT_3013485 [Cantharellus anzutake]KAF8338191.1 hypothetical protein EI90DRAFT_3013485 [Cantharellus anzutake]